MIFTVLLDGKTVTEEAYGVEPAVWPIPFLINMLTALERSQFYFLFLIIRYKSYIKTVLHGMNYMYNDIHGTT